MDAPTYQPNRGVSVLSALWTSAWVRMSMGPTRNGTV
jgi:hypothetical protein